MRVQPDLPHSSLTKPMQLIKIFINLNSTQYSLQFAVIFKSIIDIIMCAITGCVASTKVRCQINIRNMKHYQI